MPAVKKSKSGGEFITRLVSPEEFLSRKPFSLPAPTRSIPPSKAAPSTLSKHTMPSPESPDSDKELQDKSSYPSQASIPSIPSAGGTDKEPQIGNKPRVSIPKDNAKEVPLREKLFDKNVIGDLAKKHIEKEDKEKKSKTFSFDASEYKFLIYNRRLKERIENIWVYPPEAAAKGIYGDLVIRFTINKNGKLGSVELERTSGHKNLDDAAMRALRDGEPYWPLPEEWGMESYTIEGHFIYTIYGSYIM